MNVSDPSSQTLPHPFGIFGARRPARPLYRCFRRLWQRVKKAFIHNLAFCWSLWRPQTWKAGSSQYALCSTLTGIERCIYHISVRQEGRAAWSESRHSLRYVPHPV